MLHRGHLNIISRAKERCDFLIVGVSTDELVETYKHKTPIVPFRERLAIVEALSFVDLVVPQQTMDKFAAWQQIPFDVMFHGDEWKGTDLYNEYERRFAEVGVRIEYLPHTEGISSSILREKVYGK